MLEPRQRQAMLAAMGIDVYLLRQDASGTADAAPAAPSAGDDAGLVVACAHRSGDDAHAARLRRLLPLALGVDAARVHWIEADAAGQLAPVPAARAYLALGAEMPRALGVQLSTKQQMSATIAAADGAAASLRDGLSRRALWQALKPLARALRMQ